MLKNDTWQDGNTLDTMGEMDSAGSCDSVVSFNSCFSDDSLEFLSAEEKACLMFLEETIQSLDTEDDSGLSNDEPDQMPTRGNVATKAAHLSASIGLNKPPSRDVTRHHFEGSVSSGNPEKNAILNYMVPTPFILANCNSRIPNRPGVNVKMASENGRVPSEVNVDVIPPQYPKTKGKKDTEENLNTQKSSRGPLSYEGLVQLRKTASVQKNTAAEAKPEKQKKILHISNDKGASGTSKESISSKRIPPPVAPKPKITASTNQQIATSPSTDATVPFLTGDKLMNPEKVRLEALCKLGLLEVESSNMKKLSTKGHTDSPVHSQTSSHITSKPLKLINQPVPSCNPLHQGPASDICTDPPCSQHTKMTSAGKAATLERTRMGRSKHEPSGSDITKLNTVYQESCSSTVETKIHLKDVQIDQVSSSRFKSQHVQGFSVPVPSIGKERREALLKLGLLKN